MATIALTFQSECGGEVRKRTARRDPSSVSLRLPPSPAAIEKGTPCHPDRSGEPGRKAPNLLSSRKARSACPGQGSDAREPRPSGRVKHQTEQRAARLSRLAPFGLGRDDKGVPEKHGSPHFASYR